MTSQLTKLDWPLKISPTDMEMSKFCRCWMTQCHGQPKWVSPDGKCWKPVQAPHSFTKNPSKGGGKIRAGDRDHLPVLGSRLHQVLRSSILRKPDKEDCKRKSGKDALRGSMLTDAAVAVKNWNIKFWKAGLNSFFNCTSSLSQNREFTWSKIRDQPGTSDVPIFILSPGAHEYLRGLRGARVSGGCFHSRLKPGSKNWHLFYRESGFEGHTTKFLSS